MKAGISGLVFGFLCVAALVHSAEIKEKEVLNSIAEIRVGINETFKDITSTAMKGNDLIGRVFQVTEDENLPKVLTIMDNMKADILAHKFTLAKAKSYFANLKALMDELKEYLTFGVSMLPKESAQQILKYFESGYSRLFAESPKFYQYAKIIQP